MPNSPNTSFIPKQGPIRRQRQTVSRQVYVFSVISYVILASVLVASAGVFLYQRHVEKGLQDQVAKLDQAIASFSEADMEEVRAFNARLSQTRSRLDNGVSVAMVLEALEAATLKSVTLNSLSWERMGDDMISLKAEIDTDSFDSSLFQRGILERSDIIQTVEVEDLAISETADEDGEDTTKGISFTANIGVPIDRVPNTPRATTIETSGDITLPADSGATSTVDTFNNSQL